MSLDPDRIAELGTAILASWGGAGTVLNMALKRVRKIITAAVKGQTGPQFKDHEARIAALERAVFKTTRTRPLPPDDDAEPEE